MKININERSDLGEILSREELKHILGGMTGSDEEDRCKGLPSTTYCRDGSGKTQKEVEGTGCPDSATFKKRCEGVKNFDLHQTTCNCVRPKD